MHAARWKYRTQKWRIKSPSGHHRTIFSDWIFASKACVDNRKKLIKQQYLLHMSSQYDELRPTSGWDRFGSLRHHSKFQRVSRLGFVTAATSFIGGQPNFARCLAVSWTATLHIYFRGILPPDGISPHAKFALRPSLAFSCIASVTASHSSSGRQPNCGMVEGVQLRFRFSSFSTEGATYIPRAAITMGIGPDSSFAM